MASAYEHARAQREKSDKEKATNRQLAKNRAVPVAPKAAPSKRAVPQPPAPAAKRGPGRPKKATNAT